MTERARRGIPSGVAIRPATLGDEAGIRTVLAGHGNDGPVVTADVVGPYVRHLIARRMAHVAVDGRSIVGFAAALDTGRSIHLADLFVHVDQFMASDPDLVDPTRLVPNPGML